MLSWTPSSYVAIYSEEDIALIPATAITDSNRVRDNYKTQFYYRNVYQLFKLLLTSTIGDRTIAKIYDSASVANLFGITNYVEIIAGTGFEENYFESDMHITNRNI